MGLNAVNPAEKAKKNKATRQKTAMKRNSKEKAVQRNERAKANLAMMLDEQLEEEDEESLRELVSRRAVDGDVFPSTSWTFSVRLLCRL